ncbi:hypothetical protein CIHG_09512 [Coccidioides immitis H538.4]|uniref:Uncharacterized protein n=1 Tax=Coccidioides immitis H538.4 TaxID=396776 RepID=A0A0J8S2T0_COCIT|nr:hypothetical protein CIHG_09512 [Coccidioides immitis H538.4]
MRVTPRGARPVRGESFPGAVIARANAGWSACTRSKDAVALEHPASSGDERLRCSTLQRRNGDVKPTREQQKCIGNSSVSALGSVVSHPLLALKSVRNHKKI